MLKDNILKRLEKRIEKEHIKSVLFFLTLNLF